MIFASPLLTRRRMRIAFAVAVTTDLLQVLLGPLGWAGADEVLDIAAMLLISGVVGFHPLLLPTFALEFVPIVDMLPTWTGCVALVVALRKKQQTGPLAPAGGDIVDVEPVARPRVN